MPAGKMTDIRARVWAEFKSRAAGLGMQVTEPEYLGSAAKHRARCRKGHNISLVPNSVQQGKATTCQECKTSTGQMKEAFESKLRDHGAKLLTPWTGTKTTYSIQCKEGHETSVKPINLLKMHGVCKFCNEATRRQAMLEDFRRAVESLGGKVIEEIWLGAQKPHQCLCKRGHVCSPRPSSVKSGQGICSVCAGNDAEAAWVSFVGRMNALGAEVLEASWLGSEVPHRVRCKGGHEIRVWPSGAGKGKGICRTCVGLDPRAAERYFRESVEAAGGTVLYVNWEGVNRPHRILCPEGHLASPRPNDIQQGHTMCRSCAGKDPRTAWRNFIELVRGLEGEVLEKDWRGSQVPHLVRCRNGHVTRVRPAGVQQGQGICRFCAGRQWDVFYVVVNDDKGHVKFGITSGDPRQRLRYHRTDGFRKVVRLLTALPGDDAPTLERAVLLELQAQDKHPVRGREYYLLSELSVVLGVVDTYRAAGPKAVAPFAGGD